MKRIALLGPGTYTEQSAHHFLGTKDYEYIPCATIYDVFAAAENGTADYSVIPIENTFDGSIVLHLNWLFHETDLPIQTEWVYPIVVSLLGPASAPVSESLTARCARIRKVVSHAVTLTQCSEFLRDYLPHAELESVGNNGEAARIVSELDDPSVVTLAPHAAGILYGLASYASDVQDHDNNHTRFVLVGREPLEVKPTATRKTTILVTLPEDYPGALHQVLSAFAWRRINLSRIESRPTKKKLGSYFFYIDIEMPLDTVLLPAALQEIEAIGCQVRLLGSYPTYIYEPETSEV